jgi:hypothetical protein
MPQQKKQPDWFEKRIAELLKTAAHLRSMQVREFTAVKIHVPRKKVEAYWRGAHQRTVYRKKVIA